MENRTKIAELLLNSGGCTIRGVVSLCERSWSGLKRVLVVSWLECGTEIGDFL